MRKSDERALSKLHQYHRHDVPLPPLQVANNHLAITSVLDAGYVHDMETLRDDFEAPFICHRFSHHHFDLCDLWRQTLFIKVLLLIRLLPCCFLLYLNLPASDLCHKVRFLFESRHFPRENLVCFGVAHCYPELKLSLKVNLGVEAPETSGLPGHIGIEEALHPSDCAKESALARVGIAYHH